MNCLRPRFGALFLVLFCFLTTGSAFSQVTQADRDYYQSWQSTAERAESVIDAARASDASLEALREEIAEFRERFLDSSDENVARVRTLQDQIEALGPPPGDGEVEAEDLANLRSRLNRQLDALRVPAVVSQEAYSRANGLIAEIDRIIRLRQARQLTERGPSPLNISHWREVAAALVSAQSGLFAETRSVLRSRVERQAIQNDLPVTLFIGFLGLLLVARGRTWAIRAGRYLRSFGGRGTGIWSFVVSILQILLPLLGVVILVVGIYNLGITGLRGQTLLENIPQWAASFLLFAWIGGRLYARDEDEAVFAHMSSRDRGKMRRLILWLGFAVVADHMVQVFEQVERLSDASRAVLVFPVVLLGAYLLWRIRRIAFAPRAAVQTTEEGSQELIKSSLQRLLPLLNRVIAFIAIAGPVLAIFGHTNGAEKLIFSTIGTLGLIGVAMILQRFLLDIYAWVSKRGDAAKDDIFPVLTGFAIAFLSLPFLVLIWGARVADLTELWARFLEGFTIGETRISPIDFITFVLIFVFGYALTRFLQGSLRATVLPRTRLDPGAQTAIVSGTGYIGILLAALIAVSVAGLNLSSLAIVAGALSVGIGFGLQNIVSNFVSGIILLIERPVAEGDWIEVGNQMGYVRDISVRSTRIETFDRSDVIVPNSDLVSGTVINYTRGNTVGRVIVPVGVAYGTDTKRVEAILREIAEAHPMILLSPPPAIVFQGFGADALDFEIRGILRDVNWVLSVKTDLNHAIAERFGAEGIEIPFAQRDVWLRNPEALAGQDNRDPAPVPSSKRRATAFRDDLPDDAAQADPGDD